MKKLKSLIFTLFTAIVLFAQSPQSINYQAIAWNANNTPRTNQTITVTFNIRALTTTGTIEFTETHTTSTNEQGLFTLGIGSANQNGFKAIDWSKGPKFMQVIVDGLPAGTTQILSVPYALYAEKTNLQAGSGISVSGNTITNTGDLDNTNEIQTISRTGNVLTLSKGGGTVDLPSAGGGGATYSAGSGISISPTNIISADLKAGEGIAIVGNTISNTNTGGGGTGTTYTAGTGIKISGNTISNTGDGDTSTTNEIQQLSINGSQLSLSRGGGSVTLPAGTGGGTATTYTAGTGITIDGSNKITATSGTPAGSIMAYGGATPPDGWLLCDGTTVSSSKYPELFAAIGTNWGDGGSGSFNLPDLRGMFLRGIDGTAGNDPNKTTRTSKNGSNSGNRIGSYQDDQFQGHHHNGSIAYFSTQPFDNSLVRQKGPDGNGGTRAEVPGVQGPVTDGTNGTPRTGSETRPKNVYVLYIIKY